MLSFDLRSLEDRAAPVDGDLQGSDPIWQEGDVRPVGAIRVSGRLSAAGAGRFYFSGSMRGTAASQCRRCLDEVTQPVSGDLHLLLVDESADEAEEADVYLIDTRERELDLRAAIREEWLLAAPAFMVCSESCRGFCPSCGANLNHGDCGCNAVTDPRWQALSSLDDKAR